MKLYCTSCGKPTEYLGQKPNFCQSCGNSFGVPKNAQQKNAKPKKIEPQEEEYDEDGEEEDELEESEAAEIPQIDGLDFSVSIPKNSQKIQSIMGTQSAQSNGEGSVRQTQEVSQQEFLENFKREAGTLRNK